MRLSPWHYQADLLADRSRGRLILKARQIGISQGLTVESAHFALHKPDSTILWLSKDQGSANQVLGYIKTILHGLNVPLVRDAETSIKLTNGSKIVSLPASPTTARSFAASAVYLDEFAFARYAQEIYQSASPTTSHGGRLTVVSTPNGRANMFFLLWSGQQGGEWSRHIVYWYDCPAYNPQGWHLADAAQRQAIGEQGRWYKDNRPKYTAQSWAQEFGCDFVTSGAARFMPDDIEQAHNGALGRQAAQEGRDYTTAWDIGRRRDATVGITLTNETPFQIVAYERFEGLSFPAIQRKIEERAAQYPGATYVESNGIGDAVIENLNIGVEPFITTAKSKQQILDGLSLALERGDLKWRDIAQLDTEMLLYQDDDSGLIQDSVMALAIAVRGVGYAGPLLLWGSD